MKTTISDLGYADYSEYFIGHSGSTYWRKKDLEKADIFRKIEPYLTFLNVHQLERQGADILSKVEELEDWNQSLRNHDKMKDNASQTHKKISRRCSDFVLLSCLKLLNLIFYIFAQLFLSTSVQVINSISINFDRSTSF